MTFDLNSDQHRAASTLERSVVVTAGAGSGKTRMLTERFVNAVVPGRIDGWAAASVDDIVAITFTDKAAGELAERVRHGLRDAGLIDEARRVDGGWVSTIHGLCSRLLRRHAFEAGVDPLFEVAETVAIGRIRGDAFERAALRLVATDADVAALLDAYGYGRVFDAVAEVTRELAVRGMAVSDIELEPARPLADLLRCAIELLSDGRTACDDYSGTAKTAADFSENCAVLLENLLDLERAALDEPEKVARLAALLAAYKPLRRLKGLEEASADSEARGVALKSDVGAALVAPYARGLVRLTEAFSAQFTDAKNQAGVLDFDDLQLRAVELLSHHPSLARRYRERFRLVMIDEFQDTDSLQLRLVESLAHDDLCTVGDEKQSIYRFRGADIGVYRRHRAEMVGREALEVSLGVNYRSHPEILSFVNAVFSAPDYFDGDLLRLTPPDGARPMQPIDDALGDERRVEAIFIDSSSVDAAAARRVEAREIACRLAGLRDRGVDPAHMVILVRAYSSAHVYAEALSAENLPAIIVGGSRFFGLAEIAIMRALTRAIANPADGSAVGELLASEFSSVSDDGLARLRVLPSGRDNRALWEALKDTGRELPGDDGEAVRRLIELVERARHDAGSRPLADVLLQAVEDAGYDLRLLSRGNIGRDAFANVMKFARQASAFEANSGSGPAGFSAYLDAKERLGDMEAPASVADDGSSAVRIMSVHASKGLEFSVVVVPDLASSGRGSSAMARTMAVAEGLRIALTPPPSDDGVTLPRSTWANQFAEAESEAEAEESNRVLYVAFTRARDLLIASGSMNMQPKSPSKANHHLIRLARLLGVAVPSTGACDVPASLPDGDTGQLASCRVRVVEAGEGSAQPDGGASEQAPLPCALAPRPGARFAGAEAAVAPPETVSYSSLHLFAQCARRFLIQEVLRLSPIEIVDSEAHDPMRFGSALHSVLQLVGADGSLPEEHRIATIGRQFELDDSQLERLRRAVESVVGSETMSQAIAHQRVAREMPFALPIADRTGILSGSVDLFARSGDEALVVDYKSGTSGTADELAARYELQAQCYALAALVDGCESVEVVFVRPEVTGPDGGVQEVRHSFARADETVLRGLVEARYRQIVSSPYEPLSERDESICGSCAAPIGLCPNARP